MSIEELNTIIKNAGKNVLNRVQMGLSYGWSEDYAYKEIKESFENVKTQLKELITDFDGLTGDELLEIGFRKWDEESELYLCPIWFFDLIPDGTQLTSIDGATAIKGKDEIDLDVRFGLIAWGVLK